MILKVGDRVNVMRYERHNDRTNPVRVFKESGYFQCYCNVVHDTGESDINAVYMLESGFLKSCAIEMVARVSQ